MSDVIKDLVLDVFVGDLVLLFLDGLLHKVNIMRFKTLWEWLVVFKFVGVNSVLNGDYLVVSHQTGEVLLGQVDLVVVKSSLISDLVGDELGVVS